MAKDDAYGSIARNYDSFVSLPMRRVRRSISELLPPEGAVIDIGCGTGEQCAALANGDREIVGVDASPAMLAIAEKRREANLNFKLCDACKTDFPDGSFSAAVVSFILHENDHKTRSALISEATRLVGDQGVIVIAEYQPVKGLWAGFLSLGFRLVERLAGGEHYLGFRDWMASGGLAGFCNEYKLNIQESRSHYEGNIVVVRCNPL